MNKLLELDWDYHESPPSSSKFYTYKAIYKGKELKVQRDESMGRVISTTTICKWGEYHLDDSYAIKLFNTLRKAKPDLPIVDEIRELISDL